jgi:hypothetical protein
MNLGWSPEAAADFAVVVSYIYEDNPSAAEQPPHDSAPAKGPRTSRPRPHDPGRLAVRLEAVLFPLGAGFGGGCEKLECIAPSDRQVRGPTLIAKNAIRMGHPR